MDKKEESLKVMHLFYDILKKFFKNNKSECKSKIFKNRPLILFLKELINSVKVF